jgi:hypothetical protein
VPSSFAPKVASIVEHLSWRYRTDIADAWEAEGTVKVPIFEWWFQRQYEGGHPSIADMMRQEFDMYDGTAGRALRAWAGCGACTTPGRSS